MKKFAKLMSQFKNDDSGATAIEYGLIAALVAVVLIGALSAMGTSLTNKFNEVNNALN